MQDLTFEEVVNKLEELFTSDSCSSLRAFLNIYSNHGFLQSLNKMLDVVTSLIEEKPEEQFDLLGDVENFAISQGLAIIPILMLKSVPDEEKHLDIIAAIINLCDNYYNTYGNETNKAMIDAIVKLMYVSDQYDKMIYLGNRLINRFEGIINSDRNYYSYSQNFLDYLLKEDKVNEN